MKPVRCAIYTRKSSEEGLEQDFNSLDAQREACAAYVLSQAGEGWTALPDHYDDGGISGGTLERPALQRLLADVDAGRIDIIVVYKVDRLSRSLFDFAKLVERFEAAGTSFVSVTQSFNTTTSMGRLTLNMLLSFAQFEREVTAERIRDKLAASKAKGMWMGGVPPLGYKPDGRTLAVVEKHAALVRHIYERYAALRSVRALGDELLQHGTHMPKRVTITGKPTGGGPFSRGQLYALLTRRLYLGEITHKGTSHPGLHQPIIASDLFEQVQQIIADNKQGDHRRSRAPRPHLLAGKVVDAFGEPLTATHATKGTARYRYYVSHRLNQGRSTDGMRVPARELETVVVERIAAALDDPIDLVSRCALPLVPSQLAAIQATAGVLAARVRGRDPAVIAELVARVTVYPDRVSIACAISGIAGHLGFTSTSGDSVELSSDVALKRSGIAVRLVQPDGSFTSAGVNPSLIRLLVRARRWWAELKKGEIDATRLAEREGVTRSYLLRVTKLAFLSPALTDQILRGTQGAQITPAVLVAPDAVGYNWKVQVT